MPKICLRLCSCKEKKHHAKISNGYREFYGEFAKFVQKQLKSHLYSNNTHEIVFASNPEYFCWFSAGCMVSDKLGELAVELAVSGLP
jgi:hypothetical protein